MLEDRDLLTIIADEFAPDVIVHLAAQAGVRYSLENPRLPRRQCDQDI
jgi:UDP-glucuronate 4-epimerase